MPIKHADLKARQRLERDNHPEALALRVHRSLSWLGRAEHCDDEDGRFIFFWIAFNSAYANETGEIRIGEGQRFNTFLEKLVDLDEGGQLSGLVWQQYPSAIRVLLDNQYVFQPFWDHQNQLPDSYNWEAKFQDAKQGAHRALSRKDTAKVLGIVFSRLYTLRNQMIHGGATWNSSVNRSQLRDGNRIIQDVVPIVIEIMLDNANVHWGEACYPVK